LLDDRPLGLAEVKAASHSDAVVICLRQMLPRSRRVSCPCAPWRGACFPQLRCSSHLGGATLITQLQALQAVPVCPRQILTALCADTIAPYVLNCVPRDMCWRRGQWASEINKHPSSPTWLPPASYTGTQPDTKKPFSLHFSLVVADLEMNEGSSSFCSGSPP
jgi:hypothetical protein